MSRDFLVIGHRGWPSRYPDNTLPGFVAAANVADMVELDVRRSADGKLVIAHDPVFGKHVVAATPWSILAEVDLGAGAKPCLLDEAVAALPDTPIIMEVKNQPGDPGYEPDSQLALEAAERMRPKDLLISFNWQTVDAVKRNFPDADTGLNVGLMGDLDEALGHCRAGSHSYVVPEVRMLSGRGARDSDAPEMLVWSADRGETFVDRLDELASLEVSGIITDDPGLLFGALR